MARVALSEAIGMGRADHESRRYVAWLVKETKRLREEARPAARPVSRR